MSRKNISKKMQVKRMYVRYVKMKTMSAKIGCNVRYVICGFMLSVPELRKTFLMHANGWIICIGYVINAILLHQGP